MADDPSARRPVRQLLALTGRRPSLCSADGLRRLIAEALPYRRLEDAAVPVQVTATNVLTGAVVCLGSGDAVTAVLASAAIPAVLPAGYACALTRPPAGALAAVSHAVALLVHQRLLVEVAEFADHAELHVLPPLCPVSVSPIDFSRTAELIARGQRATRAWLADGGDRLPDPERFLSLHHHTPERDGNARRLPDQATATGI